MKTISPYDLHQRLLAQPNLPLVDVRTPAEFDQVHATAAINEPLDRFDPQALAGQYSPSEDKPVFLICRTGTRAENAAQR
ncbi:MAG: rhodanese-like domain-containing protein, partial [Verrucomicrobiae bacterium]|nr:rhodanese-like domain-containing protein [Verrucomicrobiae bacterium]